MAATTKTIDIHDPQADLSELISLVKVGFEIILMDEAKPIARLVPEPLADLDAEVAPTPRIAGLHAGVIWTSDDFDEPLPDEFWLGTE